MSYVVSTKSASNNDFLENGKNNSDDYNKTTPTKPTQVRSIQELPYFLRISLQYNASSSRLLKAIFLLVTLINQSSTPILMLAVTKSMVITFAMLAACLFVQIPTFLSPNYKYEVEHNTEIGKLFWNSTKDFNKKVQEFIIGMTILMGLIFFPLVFLLFAVPTVNAMEPKPLGEYTFTVTWIIAILSWCTAPLFFVLTAVNQIVVIKVQESWSFRVDAYLKLVHDALMSIDTTNTNSEEEAMVRISTAQNKQEKWARKMNDGFSSMNGMMVIGCTILIFAPIGVLPLASASTNSERAIQIGIMSFFSILSMGFLSATLSAVTKPNVKWANMTTRLMNDIRIQNLNIQLITNGRLEKWLSDHELSAARALGVKITVMKLQQAIGFVGSLLAVVFYFILRDELRELLA